MPRCLISFGANLGDAESMVHSAYRKLADMLGPGDRIQLSRLYQTPPIGGPSGQPPFVNAVAALHTSKNPWEIWHRIREVERYLGRVRIRRWEARKIDLDILLYDEIRIWTPQLKIPHPRMCMRRFILLPACDVAADWRDPVTQWSIEQLASQVSRGKGNLILVAERGAKPEFLLQEVARTCRAQWVPIENVLRGSGLSDRERTVSWIDFDRFSQAYGRASSRRQRQQPPEHLAKLLFVLRPSRNAASWEDEHRRLAESLRLSEPPPCQKFTSSECFSMSCGDERADHRMELSIAGPRYLLATNDLAWASHEMVAALEAMDCPVEPLAQSG